MKPSDFPEFAIPINRAPARGNEPRLTPPKEGPAMYVVTRECSPDWESPAAREVDLKARLRGTKGQLAGVRANLKAAVEECRLRSVEYGTGNALVYALATIGQTIDWIDMISGPTYLEIPESGEKGGEKDGS